MGTLYGECIDATSPRLDPLTDDAEIIRQALELALATPRGTYWSAPEYGCDLCAYVARGLTPEALAAIPAEVQSSLAQDERFARVVVTVDQTTAAGGASLTLSIEIIPAGADAQPFAYVAEATADIVAVYTRGLS